MNIELQSYWRDAAGTIHAELELVERLAGAENGIFVFTGKSGCGKSRILRQLKRQRPVRVFSTEEITDMLLAFCKESIHTSLSECLAATLSGFSCIAIEDIDLWYGKENTLLLMALGSAKSDKKSKIRQGQGVLPLVRCGSSLGPCLVTVKEVKQ